jgi:hypothetical protein
LDKEKVLNEIKIKISEKDEELQKTKRKLANLQGKAENIVSEITNLEELYNKERAYLKTLEISIILSPDIIEAFKDNLEESLYNFPVKFSYSIKERKSTKDEIIRFYEGI